MLENIKKLPKIELHCHVDGSMSYEITQKLAAQIGEEYTLEELRQKMTASMDCLSLAEYLSKFDLPLRLIGTYDGLRDISYDFIRQSHMDGVVYTEARFAPNSSLFNGLSYREIFEAVHEGLAQGKKDFGVESGMIVCAMRHAPMEDNLRMLRAAAEAHELGVVGVDIAGDEKTHTNLEYKEYWDKAAYYGFPFTIHSGECGSASNITEAIELGAGRIGHGIAMSGHKDIINLCVQKGVGVEMCPNSNLQTKAVADLDNYPFMEFFNAGVGINISTDNRTVSDTTCTKEYELLDSRFGLTPDMYRKLYRDSVDMSFAGDDVKDRLLKLI